MSKAQHPYEEPFLLGLLLIATVSITWLFSQFIPALLFALLISSSSFALYQRLSHWRYMNATRAAGVMTVSALLLIFIPISYLMSEGARMGSEVFSQLQTWLAQQTPESIQALQQQLLSKLPLPDTWLLNLSALIETHLPEAIQQTKALSLWTASNLFSGISSFIGFMAIALFSLFFFYRDGQAFTQRLTNLSPLAKDLNAFILHRFTSLSRILVTSVVGIAVLQGISFALLMFIFDLPWVFLGIAFAIASFIPVVGGLLIWAPVSIYFLIEQYYWSATIVAIYSALFIGFIIDNILRAYLIKRLSAQDKQNAGKNALDHSWLTLLSTFAGLLHFGMMGLVFGPMLAAMAITIFDVYEHKHLHQLD